MVESLLLSLSGLPQSPSPWDRGSQRVTKALHGYRSLRVTSMLAHVPMHLFCVGRGDFSLTGKIRPFYRSVLEETLVVR